MTTEQINAASTQEPASTPTQTGAANPGSTEAKFTQADLEREIAARVERAEKREARVRDELLEKLGLAKDTDFNVIKSVIADAQKKADAEKSAEQRLAEVTTKKDQTITELQQQIASLVESQRVSTIETELKAEMAKLKAISPKAVLAYMRDSHREAMRGLMDEEGKIDDKKMAELLETVKKEEPALFGSGTVTGTVIPSNANGRTIQPDAKAKQDGKETLRRQIRSGF